MHLLASVPPPPPAGSSGCDETRERRLLQRHARFTDPAARAELVERFLPLAKRVALRYARSGEPIDDLLQVACVGLLKAIDRFDPDRGLDFSSYALPTIAGELRRYFRDCGWAVHIPRPDQERFLAVRSANRALSAELGRSPTPREVAASTGLPVEEVLSAIEVAGAAYPAPLEPDDGEDDGSPSDRFGREDQRLELVEDRVSAARGVRLLERREQQILFMRFLQDMSQSEIARRLGVSQMHVSRLLRRALIHARGLADEPDSTGQQRGTTQC
jgi:RNA polymerase sigma-B factor